MYTEAAVKAIGNYSFKTGVVTLNIKIINCDFENYSQTIFLQNTVTLTAPVGDQNLLNNYFNFRPFTVNIEGRFFHGVTTAPLHGLYSVEIRGNYIENAGQNAIGLTASKFIISGNKILISGSRGIYIYGGFDNSVTGSISNEDIAIMLEL